MLSGSDFGERKLVIWDAKYPVVDQPVQFSHMIFWTEDALIKKILFKVGPPTDQFWLNQNQLSLLPDDQDIEIWQGQQELDDPILTDSDSEDEETKRKRIGFMFH